MTIPLEPVLKQSKVQPQGRERGKSLIVNLETTAATAAVAAAAAALSDLKQPSSSAAIQGLRSIVDPGHPCHSTSPHTHTPPPPPPPPPPPGGGGPRGGCMGALLQQ
jgi:hypothetical protein